MTTPSWENVFRTGFAPSMSTAGLEALRAACLGDDPRLTQGSTTTPPSLMSTQDWPCESADAIGYAGWHGDSLTTVGEVEEYFARLCFDADQKLGEPAACRWWLIWFDDTPRGEMLRETARVVTDALRERGVRCDHPEEAAFHARLDEEPGDQTCRRAFADWLRDRDDPRADGYAAMAEVGFDPTYPEGSFSLRHRKEQWLVGTRDNYKYAINRYRKSCLPHVWFSLIKGRVDPDNDWWWFRNNRADLEDAVALAWAAVPEKEKAKILGK